MLKGHGAVKVLYVNYIAAVMVQLYTYAHSGTLIAENVGYANMQESINGLSFSIFSLQSSQIAIACYFMEWPHGNKTVRQIIRMMIQRSQHAVVVRVPFFTVSLEAYAKIMSTAGSYIAVLNSMIQN